MKKYFLLFSLAFLAFVTSCTIERNPQGSVNSEDTFESFLQVESFRTGLYSIYRSSNYNLRLLSDYQVDIVNAVVGFGNRNGAMYGWQENLASDSGVESFYANQYAMLSNLNNFINNIDFVPTQNANEEALLKQYKGEAYLMRATTIHNLVRYFAKAYDPATAESDLGVAIPLEYDPYAKPARKNLAQTYAQIKADLDQALDLLPDNSVAMADYVTKDFAYGVLARVSLEMHDFAGAVAAADEIIPKYPLVTTEEALLDQWMHDTSSEILVRLHVAVNEGGSAAPAYQNLDFFGHPTYPYLYVPDYVASKKVTELYEWSDFRNTVYITTPTDYSVYVDGYALNDITMINKYPGNPEYRSNPTVRNYINAPKLFLIPEAYLIKAEAHARGAIAGTPGMNDTDAIDTLNELRVARNASMLMPGEDAFEAVKEERFREMLAEGQRLLDLKRWGEPLIRTGGQQALEDGGLLHTTGDVLHLFKPADDKMWVWEIPLRDLNTNPNMERNW